MRIPKPHWKKSHKCWYLKLKGTLHRLDPDKEKAFEMYTDLIHRYQVAEGTVSPRSMTVSDLIYTYLTWLDDNRSNETYLWYRKYLHGTNAKTGKFTRAGFAYYVSDTIRVVDLKPYHLDNWIASRYKDASDNTKAGAITAVLRVFNWAVEKGYIDRNPLDKVKKPKRESRGEEAYLTPKQWKQIIDEIEACQKEHEIEPFLDYVTVMKETGCRPQEIRKVEARHLNHELKQWVFPVKESKGKQEKRRVVLGDVAYAICCKLAMKYPTGPLFRNSDGEPWTNFAVSCRFKRLSEKLGFRVYAYAIRHTFATEAIIGGADVITVARLMGHADLTMLNRIYQHVTADQDHLEESRRKAISRSA